MQPTFKLFHDMDPNVPLVLCRWSGWQHMDQSRHPQQQRKPELMVNIDKFACLVKHVSVCLCFTMLHDAISNPFPVFCFENAFKQATAASQGSNEKCK